MYISPVILHISSWTSALYRTISVIFLNWLDGKPKKIQSTLRTNMEDYYNFFLIYTRKAEFNLNTCSCWLCCITKSLGKEIYTKKKKIGSGRIYLWLFNLASKAQCLWCLRSIFAWLLSRWENWLHCHRLIFHPGKWKDVTHW